jgi:hypothetical protein
MKLLLALLLSCFSASTQPWEDFKYQTGDLLFQDIDCGELCEAIEKVTPALDGKHFSHVGIAYVRNDSIFVVEAIGKEVGLLPLSRFLDREKDAEGRPKVVVGRLKKSYRWLAAPAVKYALTRLRAPYDDAFLPDNGKYYCSELVYESFFAANGNQAFFELRPMTFADPATGKTFPSWAKYYNDLGIAVPQGKPGCNPGLISNSDKIEILATFY